MSRGMRVVRVGQPAKVRESLRGMTLEAQAEATPAGKAATALRDSARALYARAAEAEADRAWGPGARDDEARRLAGAGNAEWKRADAMLRDAMAGVVARSQVVCATCSGAGDAMISGRIFRAVVIDESTQATEPATLIPLTRGAECVVMAGDPKQLPPTIVSEAAYRFGLDVTLFDRLVEGGACAAPPPARPPAAAACLPARAARTHRAPRCRLSRSFT